MQDGTLVKLLCAPKSIAETLSILRKADRFPISLPVLQLLLREELSEAELLETLRADERVVLEEVEKGVWMVMAYTAQGVEAEAKPLKTIEDVRDAVLAIHSFPKRRGRTVTLRGTCRNVIRDRCSDSGCQLVHFVVDARPGLTDESAGFCSYMDLCKNASCKFVHLVRAEPTACAPREEEDVVGQWINCDVRHFPFSVFHGLVSAVLIDPPWDIHMELSYGTLTDDELRALPIADIHSDTCGGFMFIWATSRTVEIARDCLRIWGYHRADDLVWVKVNQILGTVRSGRTGHWLNHNKEHCLVGVKGDCSWSNVGSRRVDCDVIVAPVRENSRKPDELYGVIERLVGDEEWAPELKLEIFGRQHNVRPGWVTLGNQLDGQRVTHEGLVDRLQSRKIVRPY